MRQSISFVKKIRILVECRFTNPDEHIIADALIFGSNSKRTQTKLLDKDATLTLDTALDIARTEEVTSNQIKKISPDSSTRVDALKHGGSVPVKPRGPTIRLYGCCVLSTIFLSDHFAQLTDQRVMHVIKRITGVRSAVQSLTKR